MSPAILRHWQGIWKFLRSKGTGLRRGWCLIAFVILGMRRQWHCWRGNDILFLSLKKYYILRDKLVIKGMSVSK